jgi:hypothetical protein
LEPTATPFTSRQGTAPFKNVVMDSRWRAIEDGLSEPAVVTHKFDPVAHSAEREDQDGVGEEETICTY